MTFADARVAVQGVAFLLLSFGLACDEPADPPRADELTLRTEAAPRCLRGFCQ